MLTFFFNFLAPSPSAVSLDVPCLTPSSCCTFQYGVFFIFAIFEKTFLQLFLHVYLQGMVQNTFLACKLIFNIIAHATIQEFFENVNV